MDRILDTMRGKVVALSQNHSTSRVVQAVIKHGSDANRQDILAEMLPHVLDLSRSQHGHFCVVKLIHVLASTRAKKESLGQLARAFRGKFSLLLRHPRACTVVDDLYTQMNAEEKNRVVAEFYGPAFRVLASSNAQPVPTSLTALLRDQSGVQKRATMQFVGQQIQPLAEKLLLDPHVTHRVLAEYLRHATPLEGMLYVICICVGR